jgi:hypothetical protein
MINAVYRSVLTARWRVAARQPGRRVVDTHDRPPRASAVAMDPQFQGFT